MQTIPIGFHPEQMIIKCRTNFKLQALNLNSPEKQFNPYEVKRMPKSLTANFEKENHSFVNLALNLKAPEHAVQNPFEVVRPKETVEAEVIPPKEHFDTGIENRGLDLNQQLPIAIAVPFTPTVNHRIDFGQMKTPEPQQGQPEGEMMTPSEMLSKKLVFSPKELNCATPKRLFRKSLSTISEEAVDIDEELDCYQLELENSINEAKAHNRKYFTDIRKTVLKTQMNVAVKLQTTAASVAAQKEEVPDAMPEEDDSFDDDLHINDGNYQPFKRAYTRPTTISHQAQQRPGVMPPPPSPPGKKATEKTDRIRGMIRRSIRMITKPTKKASSQESLEQLSAGEKVGSSVMASIRQSLRKRKRPEMMARTADPEMSIIGEGFARTVYKADEQTLAKERNNLIRRSTRGMKKIFHKSENYELD